MSLKCAKTETKLETNPADTVFKLVHLVTHICSFVPNTRLPHMKRVNKVAKLALEKNATLDERCQRGAMERYCCLQWIHGRIMLQRQHPQAESKVFNVCWICKRVKPLCWIAPRELHESPASSIKCEPCVRRQIMVARSRESTLKSLKWECKNFCEFFDMEFTFTAAERLAVKNDKTYNPTEHLASLRMRFPCYMPVTEKSNVDGNYDLGMEWE